MVFQLLSVDDFLGVKFEPNASKMDYLLAVSEVAWLKSMYGEEDNLIAEQHEEFRVKKQERITQNVQSILSSYPQVVNDHHEKSILNLVVPKGKRSMPKARPRKVTEQFFCNGCEESMIKKAVEINNSEEEQKLEVKAKNREENRPKAASVDRGKIVLKFNLKGKANFAFENPERQLSILPIIGKRSREVIDERFLNKNVVEKSVKKEALEATREKKKAKRNITPSRELDIEFKNLITEIGGSLESIKFIIQKSLFKTDIKPEEGRLSIPENQSNDFLRPAEDAHLNSRNHMGRMCEMRVTLIEPSHRVSEINLRKWFMKKPDGRTSSLSYVLTTYWNEVTKRNDLKVGTTVQVWSFRKGPDLCFALVKLQD